MRVFSVSKTLLLLVCAVVMIYFTAKAHFALPVIFFMAASGCSIFYICLQSREFGLYFIVLFSALFALPGRFLYLASPVGVLVELLTWVLWINVLHVDSARERIFYIFRNNAISVALACLFTYYVLELLNPAVMTTRGWLRSTVGWLFFVRKQVSFLLFYCIAYSVLNSYRQIKHFFVFCLSLVLLIALYGIKQQWFGIARFEEKWLSDDLVSFRLFYQGGFLRKFSILTDPAAFGVICSSFGLFSLIMAIRTSSARTKTLLFISTLICLVAASYSGTRTCVLMIAAGLTLYTIMTLNEKRTYLLITASLLISVFLLFGPFQNNPVLTRIKTTLQTSSDRSANLRNINRHSIQPYIHHHPVGGGLNTSSLEGKLYNPHHALAGFPPDSGYLKILLEQGWIGFALNLLFYFLIIRHGIICFFNAVNQSIKNLYIAITVFLFSLIVGQYSQLAIAQYPLILIYYGVLAVLVKLIDFDTSGRQAVLKPAI
ncbi:MAG: O-antigen ligase family protein [Williamsia sp.]|nr:O-antigen ligase family protein [Williamsia sp.]